MGRRPIQQLTPPRSRKRAQASPPAAITNGSVSADMDQPFLAAETGVFHRRAELGDGTWTDIDDADPLASTGGQTGSSTTIPGLDRGDGAYPRDCTAATGGILTRMPPSVNAVDRPNDAPTPPSPSRHVRPRTCVNLAWTNNSAGERRQPVLVDRSDDGGSSWNPLATPAGNATTYTDSTVTEATAYEYRISALFNGSSQSDLRLG